MIATWAKGRALKRSVRMQLAQDPDNAGESVKTPFMMGVADLLLNKIKMALGLEHCKLAITGAAPITVDTLEYFGSLGICINEVYGMSECTGICTLNTPTTCLWGSCGYELPGVQVRAFSVSETDFNQKSLCPRAPSLDSSEEEYQGELCYRGRNIMMGYLAQADMGQSQLDEIEKKNRE